MDNNLKNILVNEQDANFYISGRGELKLRKFKQFNESFDKREATKMEAERISVSGDTAQIWVRSYSTATYMIQTSVDNVQPELLPAG